MNHNIFPNYFYNIGSAKEELIPYLESLPPHEDQSFMWGKKCISQKTRLSFDDSLMNLLNDNIVEFFNHFTLSRELNLAINFLEVWENKYERGNFQEIHDHLDGMTNLSCVIFCNDWSEDGSMLYFQNKHLSEIDQFWKANVLNSTYYMTPKRGDVLLFPSHMLHGVTPHREDIVRKTFSINMQVRS